MNCPVDAAAARLAAHRELEGGDMARWRPVKECGGDGSMWYVISELTGKAHDNEVRDYKAARTCADNLNTAEQYAAIGAKL